MAIKDIQPLWGIIGTGNASVPDDLKSNVSTLTHESLFLPGMSNVYSLTENSFSQSATKIGQYLPGINFYTQAVFNAYNIARPGRTGYSGFGDYSGRTSLALYKKWMELSTSASSAANIINLVWTDVAANTVVGTKGWVSDDALQKRGTESGGDRVPVIVYHKRVQYKIPFAIPAFIVIAVMVALFASTVSLSIMGKTGTGKLRRFLDTMSTGRTIGIFLWPESTDLRTDAWVKTVGKRKVTASREGVFTPDDFSSEREQNGSDGSRDQRSTEKSTIAVQQGLLDHTARD